MSTSPAVMGGSKHSSTPSETASSTSEPPPSTAAAPPPLTPPPRAAPLRVDLHARYSSSVLSSPTTPRTPGNRKTQSLLYSPFTPTGGPEDESIHLTDVQPNHSPFHDSMAWTTSWVDAAQQPKDRWKTTGDTEISRDPHYTLKRENPAQQPHQALLGALGYGGVENTDKPGESKQQLSFSTDDEGANHIRPKPPSWQPPRPSLFLLFSLTKRDDVFFHLLPCVILGVVSALVTPYMTMIVGDAFEIFATFPLDVSDLEPGQANKFVAGISSCALKLTVAGLIGLGLNTVMVAWWVCLGEKITNDLRTRVYDGVMARPMAWFDLGMGMKAVETEDGEGTTATDAEAIGAGGLMGKFARETDDVRIACGRVMGLSIQYFSVFLSCLILALVKSWQLSLVTLSAIPLVLVVSVGTNLLVNPLLLAERRAFAEASTSIERTTNMIGTVKAFNAQKIEADRFSNSIQRAKKSLTAQSAVWGICLGVSNFILLAMFVLGFWYGAKLVRQGKVGVADVMTVFWACLLASQNLQSLVPELVYIQQGKTAMASLMTIVLAPEDAGEGQAVGADRQRHASKGSSLFGDSLSPTSAAVLYPVGGRRSYLGRKSKTKEHASLQGIRPTKTTGEFTFTNVSFAYPSRPHIPALHNVSLFLPAGETTFIVGGSGSGKSTVAQLLLRLYEPASGEIFLDDRDLVYLDVDYTREAVSAVQQGCIMFDASVHDNVAMGLAGSATRRPQDATRDEIIQACKMAMIDDFIRDLPDGYDTNLGSRGASLSGGQKQRLAIARARLRDPPILILDEATSALDMTSRISVFEAIKAWRKNRTTIVITHDLSQIGSQDFVYVMKDGSVVEQGFRSDLVALEGGEFGRMASVQAVNPVPEDQAERWHDAEDIVEILEGEDVETIAAARRPRPSSTASLRPGSVGYLAYIDVLAEYANRDSFVMPPSRMSKQVATSNAGNRVSLVQRTQSTSSRSKGTVHHASVLDIPERPTSRLSGLLDPARISLMSHRLSYLAPPVDNHRREHRLSSWIATSPEKGVSEVDIKIADRADDETAAPAKIRRKFQSVTRLIWYLFPGVPKKYMMAAGVVFSIGHGVLTPFWSKYIAVLMAHVSIGGTDSHGLAITAATVAAISAADGFSIFGQFFFLDYLSADWSTLLRLQAFDNVVKQPQAWFDRRENAASRLLQILIKDADDMRPLMSTVVGQFFTVSVMLGVGLGWAMAIGWRITLVGVALAPVFALAFALGAYFINKLEARNKTAREDLSRMFYENLANIRSIRAMAMEGTFSAKFADGKVEAVKSGQKAAIANGGSHGATQAMPFFAQALLIWVSALFMVKGYYTWQSVLQIYTLILFAVTQSASILDFIPTIAKARMAASDFNRLSTLPQTSDELKGELRFPITGHITFNNVKFAYPTRPDVPILRGINFQLEAGECVAIVGPSGSGKSTIAALLQRLYEPESGDISVDRYHLAQADVRWLRDHIAMVSQTANLFDGTVEENIAYGSGQIPFTEVQRAGKAANVHDFIMTLPNGYQTNLGENASLISGGQLQRLQIARALVKRSSILILDECTSALDPENQQAVLDTIMKVKQTRTTIFVTHKADVMQRCDRVLCLSEGVIAEEGRYEDLLARRGVFAKLMQAGEWD